MATAILAPNSYQVQNSNAVNGVTAASNVAYDEPGLVARSSTNNLYFTLVMDGALYNTVAILSDCLATDQVRIRVGSVADMSSGTFADVTVSAWSGAPPLGKAVTYVTLPDVTASSFVRIDISSSKSAIEVGQIIVGKRIECDGIDRNSQVTAVSGSSVVDGPGWTTVGVARTRRQWKATAGNVPASSYYGEWTGFMRKVGKHTGFLFIPQTEGNYVQQNAVVVRNQQDPMATELSEYRYQVELQLFEV